MARQSFEQFVDSWDKQTVGTFVGIAILILVLIHDTWGEVLKAFVVMYVVVFLASVLAYACYACRAAGPAAHANTAAHSELPQIAANEIRFDRPKVLLGEGGFGLVHRSAEGGWQGVTVAVKTLRSEGPVPPEVQVEMQREAAMLAVLRHPNVIQLLGALRTC